MSTNLCLQNSYTKQNLQKNNLRKTETKKKQRKRTLNQNSCKPQVGVCKNTATTAQEHATALGGARKQYDHLVSLSTDIWA